MKLLLFFYLFFAQFAIIWQMDASKWQSSSTPSKNFRGKQRFAHSPLSRFEEYRSKSRKNEKQIQPHTNENELTKNNEKALNESDVDNVRQKQKIVESSLSTLPLKKRRNIVKQQDEYIKKKSGETSGSDNMDKVLSEPSLEYWIDADSSLNHTTEVSSTNIMGTKENMENTNVRPDNIKEKNPLQFDLNIPLPEINEEYENVKEALEPKDKEISDKKELFALTKADQEKNMSNKDVPITQELNKLSIIGEPLISREKQLPVNPKRTQLEKESVTNSSANSSKQVALTDIHPELPERNEAKPLQVELNTEMSNRGKAKSVQMETNPQLIEKNKIKSVQVGPNARLIERSEARPVQTGSNPQLTESSKAKSVQMVTNPEMQNRNKAKSVQTETNPEMLNRNKAKSVQTGPNPEFPERSNAKFVQMETHPQLTDGSEGNSISQKSTNLRRRLKSESNTDKRRFLESKKENLRMADSSRDYGPRHRQFPGHEISPNRSQRYHDHYHTHSTRYAPEISSSRSQRYYDHYHTHSTRPSYRRNSSPDRQSAIQQGSQHSENYSTTDADRNGRDPSQQHHQHYSHPSSSKSQRSYSSPDQKRASSSESRRTNYSSSLDQYIDPQSAQAQIIQNPTQDDQTSEHSSKETNQQKQKQPPSSLTTNAQAYNQPKLLQTSHASHGHPMFLPMNYHQPLLQAQAVNVSTQPAGFPLHAYPLQNPTQTNFIYQSVQPMIVQPQPGPLVITQITPQPVLPQYMPTQQGPSTQYQSDAHHVITINTNSGTNNSARQNQHAFFDYKNYPSNYSEREPASQNVIVIRPTSNLTEYKGKALIKYKNDKNPTNFEQYPTKQHVPHSVSVNNQTPSTSQPKVQESQLDEAYLIIFMAIKAINHPVTVDDFPLLWKLHNEKNADFILELIDKQTKNNAEHFIENLRTTYTLLGKNITLFDEIMKEMSEFEQNFSTNLPKYEANTTLAEHLKLMFVFARLFRKTQMLLSGRAFDENSNDAALMDWLYLLADKISILLVEKACNGSPPFSNAVRWLINMKNLESQIELIELAIFLTLPNSMQKTFKNLAKPTMIKNLFNIMDGKEFMSQFNLIWRNPWSESNKVHLIRKKIGKNASSYCVNNLGIIFDEQMKKLKNGTPISLEPKCNRRLHLQVFWQLRLTLEKMPEFTSISAQKKNAIAFLDGCIKVLRYTE